MIRPTKMKTLPSVRPKDIPKTKERIKNNLPVLSYTDLRRYKIPYNEVVVLELHEEGYHEAAEYFEFLFDLDEETRNTAGPDTVIWNKPRLEDNKELISLLREVLKKFRQQSIPAIDRTIAMIEMALYIENLTWEWWWIGETIYRSIFWIAKEVENDGGRILTILRYFYARFLFNQMKNPKAALEYVREAQQDSREKPWNASKILGFKKESLFRECCTLLHKVLISIAKFSRDSDIKLAVDSCKVALFSATESGHEEYVAEAQLELGRCEIHTGDIREALNHFSKSLAILEKIPDPKSSCVVLTELASAYKKLGDEEAVLKYLQQCKDTAIEFHLQEELARAHFLIGEYYLSLDKSKEATPNLDFAYHLFNQLGMREETKHSRCLVGVSKGREMTEAYQTLIKKSIEGDFDATMKICHWRDYGEFLHKDDSSQDEAGKE